MRFLLLGLLWLVLDLLLVRDIYWLSEFALGKRFLVNFILSGIAFILLLSLLRGITSKKGRFFCSLLIVLPLLLQAAYFQVYRQFITTFALRFFTENPTLSLQLWLENSPALSVLLLLIMAICLLHFNYKLKAIKRFWRYFNGTLLALIIFAAWFSWYGSARYQHSVIAFYGNTVSLVKKWQYQTLSREKTIVPKYKVAKNTANVVWVIGESLNRNQMSLYGYHRKTTPNLDKLAEKGRLFRFDNVTSIGNKTRSSVPYLLKGLQGIDPKGIVYQYPDIFDYAKALGYETAMMSAQDWRWGEFDQLFIDKDVDTFKNGDDFSSNISVSKGADDLLVLEKGVKPWLKKSKTPFLLVLQMDGSHYPYSKHSPKAYKKFLPERSENDINAYDNTVVYSDIYLADLIKTLFAQHPNSWLFFAPDHGQNISATQSTGFFNEGYSQEVIHSPLFVVPPLGHSKAIGKQLTDNQNAPISQADIFATLLDIYQIKPVGKEIDGHSLLKTIDKNRLRITSAEMITFFNDGTAVVILPDLRYYAIDLERGTVTMPDGKTVIPYEQFPHKHLLDKRL